MIFFFFFFFFAFWCFLCARNHFVKKKNNLKIFLISSFYYTTHVYRQPLTLLFPLCKFLFMFLGDVCKLNKTPRDSTCLEEPPGGCCCCFTSLEVFTFRCHQHSTMGSQAREGLHQLWAPGCFRLLYFCQAFPSQFFRERYGFERTFFIHRRF